MSATIISQENGILTIQLTVELSRSMLGTEEAILAALNEAGNLATGEALKQFDTEGSPLELVGRTWTSKGQVPKIYQTPYGELQIDRHLYQNSDGGETFCPLDNGARIVVTSTPRFAKQVSSKYAMLPATKVACDLAENHGRQMSRSYLQNLSEAVGRIVQQKEESWHYSIPKLKAPVQTVSIGVDGTCLLLSQEGYREAMVGTISLYDQAGERLHTIYQSAPPESGKATFWQQMRRELEQIQQLYPAATYLGLADGAKDNWSFLNSYTSRQILDFYHTTGYLEAVAPIAHPVDLAKRQTWLSERCHQLKHVEKAASQIVVELKTFRSKRLGQTLREHLDRAITYFENHLPQMNYAAAIKDKLPISSGVTEAACKTVIKQRLGQSGMKWKKFGAGLVLSLRTLVLTHTRWHQFWEKISRYGLPQVA